MQKGVALAAPSFKKWLPSENRVVGLGASHCNKRDLFALEVGVECWTEPTRKATLHEGVEGRGDGAEEGEGRGGGRTAVAVVRIAGGALEAPSNTGLQRLNRIAVGQTGTACAASGSHLDAATLTAPADAARRGGGASRRVGTVGPRGNDSL